MSNSIKFIDLFAGIGGIKIAFESEHFECVFSNDIDKYCKITFDYNFYKNGTNSLFLEDIVNIPSTDLPDFDLLTAGFPCQPFSIAGYQKGFEDKGRGDLFFEIIRILKEKKPQAFFLENVKNLKTHNKGNTLAFIYEQLETIGYKVKDAVLNTIEYGNLSQNRERIYIVGFLNQDFFNRFNFPDKIPLKKTIHDCLVTNNIDNKYYYNGKPLFEKLKQEVISQNTIYQWRRIYVRENKNNVCPTLTANMGTGGHNVPIILDNQGIRKLTPRECANFQGFPKDYQFPIIPDSQLYKQIGNSVSIPVISRIAHNIRLALTNN
ncbi:DNA cytosine methyltransferase [Geminocystis sp. CENA526]|uniref:DNA cytosine methyltransferase n=1 Tax=Geminocystis sp. CENA526 TaxID=1355871 RepID=UPI003D6FE56A